MSWIVEVYDHGECTTTEYDTREAALDEYNRLKPLIGKSIDFVDVDPSKDEVKRLLQIDVDPASIEMRQEYGVSPAWFVELHIDRAEFIAELGEGDYYYRFFVYRYDGWHAKHVHSDMPETFLTQLEAANIAIKAAKDYDRDDPR